MSIFGGLIDSYFLTVLILIVGYLGLYNVNTFTNIYFYEIITEILNEIFSNIFTVNIYRVPHYLVKC